MLTILLTNIALSSRSGTEVATEQLADGLRRRGSRVLIFTLKLGALAAQMRSRGHIVVDRPSALPWRPDVIHAHHTVSAMAALAAHPGVPALFVCHDATAPFDAAPIHPQVRRVFAVDERCRARLVAEGASPHDVSLLPNAVDLRRIPARARPLPARPQRAITSTRSAQHLPILRQVCAEFGIALDELGIGSGRIVESVEDHFAGADLVFATARTALEAAAAGAGVIVCDDRGCAGFLTRERAEAWLPWNFGAGILTEPTDTGSIAKAIAEWSAAEAADASALVRAERGLEKTLDRLDMIYRDIVSDPVSIDAEAETAAVSAFISGWVPNFDSEAPWMALAEAVSPMRMDPLAPLTEETAALREQIEALSSRLADDAKAPRVASLERALAELSADVRAARSEVAALAASHQLGIWRGPLRKHVEALISKLDANAQDIPSLERALAELSADVGAARGEVAALAASHQLGIWRGPLRKHVEALSSRLEDDARTQGAPSLERALAELSADVGAARSELAALAASNQLGIWRGLRAFWRRVVPHDIRDFLSAIRHARKS